jgi:hypothetical protein
MTRLFHLLTIGTLTLGLGACAQLPEEDHSAHHPAGEATVSSPATTAGQPDMAAHMKAMQSLRERMAQARTPEERRALMDEHMKLMHEGMAMMSNMPRQGGMGGMMGGMMGGRMGAPNASPEACRQMMESHMETTRSMMRMMDGMPQSPSR